MSAPALAVFAAVSISPNVLFDVLTLGGPLHGWLTAASVGALAGIAVIMAFGPLLRSNHRPWVSTAIALMTISVAALAKSAVVLLFAGAGPLAHVVQLPSTVPQAQRTMTNLVYTLIAVGITCAAVTGARQQRERRRVLVAERKRLVEASASMRDVLEQTQAELRREAHVVLDPALDAVRDLLTPSVGEADSARVIDALSATVSDVVRPMSQRLSGENPPVTLPETEDGAEEASVVGWLRDTVDAPDSIRPIVITGLSVVGFILVAPVVRASASAYVLTFAMFAVTGLVLAIVRAAWPARWRRMPGARALITLIVVYVSVFGVMGWLMPWATWSAIWMRFGLMSTGYRTIISLAISMAVMIAQQQGRVDRGIAQVNEELARQLAVLRRHVWTIRRDMSLALHGSVQSMLVSAMLMLNDGDDPTRADEVRLRLDQALQAIDLDASAAGVLDHGLREVTNLWSPIAGVDVLMSEGAAASLDAQPDRSAACLEIVRETVGNAVRHGGARHVLVTIDVDEAGLVVIRVRDDGAGLGEATTSGRAHGLGSAMMNEVCLRWSRVDAPGGGVSVVAVLA